MPQVVAIAAASAAVWLGYKWFAKEAGRLRDSLARAEEEMRRQADASAAEPEVTYGGSIDVKELPVLERDPATGVYRPKKENASD